MSSAGPSKVTDTYWIYASRKRGDYPSPTLRSGKWLVFVDASDVDEVWDKIRRATEDGLMGSSAKVSTARPNPLNPNPRKRVICVYSYDWADEADVMRIRDELRRLGITNKIPYKADVATLEGKYIVKGHRRISKYYV